MRIIILFFIPILFINCRPDKASSWIADRTIDLGTTTPIGIAQLGNHIWIADGDNNQLVHLEKSGKILGSETGFERPMHIDAANGKLYIPEYGKDQISVFSPGSVTAISIKDSLDAPAGVDIEMDKIAIADFYNHRVLYYDGQEWISIGKKGKLDGEFHYPTDVQIVVDKIYVADAYNNRVQVFSNLGSHLLTIGETEKMNAATGIYVSKEQLFVTDFENNRVIVYSLAGKLDQILESELEKPTDILMIDNEIWITNYKSKNIKIFKQ